VALTLEPSKKYFANAQAAVKDRHNSLVLRKKFTTALLCSIAQSHAGSKPNFGHIGDNFRSPAAAKQDYNFRGCGIELASQVGDCTAPPRTRPDRELNVSDLRQDTQRGLARQSGERWNARRHFLFL
jgi:hypothetical protein